MPTYSDKAMDHFLHPRNTGELLEANAIGEIGNPACDDMVRLFLKIEKDVITQVRVKTFGCAAAIATSSILTEMAVGKALKEPLRINKEDVAATLDRLPPDKMNGSNLSVKLQLNPAWQPLSTTQISSTKNIRLFLSDLLT